jgi:hypothetical protein
MKWICHNLDWGAILQKRDGVNFDTTNTVITHKLLMYFISQMHNYEGRMCPQQSTDLNATLFAVIVPYRV